MNSHGRFRGRPRTALRLTPEQVAAARKLAFKWRDEWRAEVSDATATAVETNELIRHDRSKDLARRRAKFAEGIARLEFGRFYLNKRQRAS